MHTCTPHKSQEVLAGVGRCHKIFWQVLAGVSTKGVHNPCRLGGPKVNSGRHGYIAPAFSGGPNAKHRNKIRMGHLTTTILWAHTAWGMESGAPFLKERGPKRRMQQ